MKKITAFLIAVIMIFTLVACGTKSNSDSISDDNSQFSEDTPVDEVKTSDDDSDNVKDGKILIAYYSATGNTKEVAEYIAKTTGGELFEIVPVVPYTSDDLNWTVDGSRVNKEHDDESDRDIALEKTAPDNFSEYDTVYIGYPIWWGIAAWPVNHFVTDNDFTGKTVILFCTSADSGLGRSGELLKQMSGTGNWLEGERFQSGISEADVVEWVKSIGE